MSYPPVVVVAHWSGSLSVVEAGMRGWLGVMRASLRVSA